MRTSTSPLLAALMQAAAQMPLAVQMRRSRSDAAFGPRDRVPNSDDGRLAIVVQMTIAPPVKILALVDLRMPSNTFFQTSIFQKGPRGGATPIHHALNGPIGERGS